MSQAGPFHATRNPKPSNRRGVGQAGRHGPHGRGPPDGRRPAASCFPAPHRKAHAVLMPRHDRCHRCHYDGGSGNACTPQKSAIVSTVAAVARANDQCLHRSRCNRPGNLARPPMPDLRRADVLAGRRTERARGAPSRGGASVANRRTRINGGTGLVCPCGKVGEDKLTPHHLKAPVRRRDNRAPVRDIARSYNVSHSTFSTLIG